MAGKIEEVTNLFRTAVSLDQSKKYDEAVKTYIQGLNLLLAIIKQTENSQLANEYMKKFKDYADRAEVLKSELKTFENANKYTPREIVIKDGTKGYDYDDILHDCFSADFESVELQDPYLCTSHQLLNLVHLCEILIRKMEKLESIRLITKMDDKRASFQSQALEELKISLKNNSVLLDITFNETIHDRGIKFSNGFVAILGRGLDIYKPAYCNKDQVSKFYIGYHDFKQRECFETTITIYKHLNPSAT